MDINIVEGIRNRSIKDNMSLEELVCYIKNPDIPHQQKVNAARVCGKGTYGYDSIKKNDIPCAVLNFTHSKGYVSGNTVHKPTGYLYLDVDNNLDIDLNNSHIAAYWKSLSGTGYSIVVAVKGLTKKNLKSATREVADLLDVPFDPSAISVDRLTCISYDPDAHYNRNATVYNIHSTDDEKGISQYTTSNSYIHSMGSRLSCTFSDMTIRTSTIDDLYNGIDFNGEPVYDFGSKIGLYYDIGFAMGGVSKGSRNSTMYSVVMQLRGMNMWCSKKQMLEFVMWVNRKAFFPMLSKKEVSIIVDNVYKTPASKIKLRWPKYRRFLYNKDYDLSPSNKRSLMMSQLNKSRKDLTDKTIASALEHWDFQEFGKITMDKISQVTGVSISAIKKRSSLIKEKIKDKNSWYIKNK